MRLFCFYIIYIYLINSFYQNLHNQSQNLQNRISFVYSNQPIFTQ